MADYLIETYSVDGRLDLRAVTLVLPGRQATRRLEEILATRAATMPDPAWYPPELITLESLPEKFYEMQRPVASEMTQWLAWLAAVDYLAAAAVSVPDDNARTERLEDLIPDLPQSFAARLTLGKMLARLHYELAAEGIDFKTVAEKIVALHQAEQSDEVARWKTLARLQDLYAGGDPHTPGFLDRHGLWDLQAARLFTIERQTPEEHQRITAQLTREQRRFYLVALVDMNRLQKEILKKFASFITPVVFAPDAMRQQFDEFGCLRAEAWCDAPLEIGDTQVQIVLQTDHQTDAVLRVIDALDGRFATGEIVIGVPDKEVVPFLQDRMAQAGLPTRLIEGTPFRRSSIFQLMGTLQGFWQTRSFSDYAALVRHPDIERRLLDALPDTGTDLLTSLDTYASTFFPTRVSGVWRQQTLSPDQFQTLTEAWNGVMNILGMELSDTAETMQPPLVWVKKIESIFARVYDGQQTEHVNIALGIAKKAMQEVRAVVGLPERVAFHDVLELLLIATELESVSPPQAEAAIELTGWLDMLMDDAPVAIVTGMNDGTIPSFVNADLFLPDALRQELSLVDNRRRCARDAYAITVLQETRRDAGAIFFMAPRRSLAGDVLLPSRFFFASSDTRRAAERIRDFFAEQSPEPRVRLRNSVQPGQKKNHTFVPPILTTMEPPLSINITDLAAYRRCPYRYFLEKRLRLRTMDDAAEEMRPNEFGTLLHHVLRDFGQSNSSIRDSTSAKDIFRELDQLLTRHIDEWLGQSMRATLDIQRARARQRLRAFAAWQACWCAEGYRISDVEYEPDAAHRLSLAGVVLRGRIDRIDRKGNEIVLFDYKTSSEPPKFRHVYNPKTQEWLDFQLPLYREILRHSGYATPDDRIQLAYIAIPSRLKKTGRIPSPKEWDEAALRSAVAQAEAIVREMVSQDWPSLRPVAPPPKFSEDYAFICHDGLS